MKKTLVLICIFAVSGTLGADGNCLNSITFKPIGDLEYTFGSEELKELSADSDKYSCYDLENVPSGGSRSGDVASIMQTELTREYLPTINAFANDDPVDGQGCYDGNGRFYCCPEGMKYYTIEKLKLCELIPGEKVKAGPYKITASMDTQGNSKGYAKVAAVVSYSCNQMARGRIVSLRFNGKENGKCRKF